MAVLEVFGSVYGPHTKLTKTLICSISFQRNYTDQQDFRNWLAHGSTTGCDYHYAPLSLLMSTFLIRSTSSQSSGYLNVITRLRGFRPIPNQYFKLRKCWELKIIKNAIGGSPLTCGQQSAGVFSEDNAGQNLGRILWNTYKHLYVHTVE